MSVVQDAIIAEMQSLMKISVDYKRQIDAAKTKTKKNILTKKLHKNNRKIAALSTSLDTFIKREKEQEKDNE